MTMREDRYRRERDEAREEVERLNGCIYELTKEDAKVVAKAVRYRAKRKRRVTPGLL